MSAVAFDTLKLAPALRDKAEGSSHALGEAALGLAKLLQHP